MKQKEILEVLASVVGSSNIESINKTLKSKGFQTKFLLTGPTCPSFRFTGFIKALTPEGVKIFNGQRVKLIRYDDIESFEKAKTREEKKAEKKLGSNSKVGLSALPAQDLQVEKNKSATKAQSPKNSSKFEADDEDYDNDDDFDPYADEDDDVIENEKYAEKLESLAPKRSKKKSLHRAGSGSLFIPKAGKRQK